MRRFLTDTRAILLLLATFAVFLAAPLPAETMTEGIITVSHHADDVDDARWTLDVATAALAEFAPHLPPGDEPIRIIVAHTFDEFMRHARSYAHVNVSGIARSHEGLIVLKAPHLRNVQGDFRGTVRHELVHVLLHRNANTDVLPRWLNEGLCMSLANEYHWESTLTVAQMFLRRGVIEYKDLDFSFRAPGSDTEFGDAYAQALSMTRHLRDLLPDDDFFALVKSTRTQSFNDALQQYAGMTVLEFWHDYERSLWGIALIGTLASGSLFGPAAILVIIAWFRKRRSNQVIIDRWEQEEAEAVAAPETGFTWDAVVDDPDAWKEGTEYDEEERW